MSFLCFMSCPQAGHEAFMAIGDRAELVSVAGSKVYYLAVGIRPVKGPSSCACSSSLCEARRSELLTLPAVPAVCAARSRQST